MLHAEFCAWAHTLLGINVGALGSPSLSGETCQLQIVFSMGYVQLSPVAQSCLTICNPMDCSTPGLPVLHPSPVAFPDPGIELGSPALRADSLPAELLGKPLKTCLLATKDTKPASSLS